jgi:hypothetical protein
VRRIFRCDVDEGDELMIRRSTIAMMGLLVGASAAGAQTPDVRTQPAASQPAPPASDSSEKGFHDLICKPNGTEDGFDCAVEPTPAKIVPIPSSQSPWTRLKDLPVRG